MQNKHVERLSLCQVVKAENEGKWLNRLADIEEGKLVRFVFDEDAPWYFDNRDKLYLRDGPTQLGAMGVWHWTAIPRATDSEKDFIDTAYLEGLRPIELLELSGAETLEELTQILKTDIPKTGEGEKLLYCLPRKEGAYQGVFIQEGEMDKGHGKWYLQGKVLTLPLYTIEASQTLCFGNRIFYQDLSLPATEESLILRFPVDIIREVILRRSSWALMKKAQMTKSEHKHMKEYLNNVPDVTLYQEIASALNCSQEESRSLVVHFIQNITAYLDQSDLDTAVFRDMVENHEGLMRTALEIHTENWKRENEKLLLDAKKQLEAEEKALEEKRGCLLELQHQIQEQRDCLAGLEEELSKARGQYQQVLADIQEKEELARRVEERVEERILEARKNAADFIADMAFVSPLGREEQPPEEEDLQEKSRLEREKLEESIRESLEASMRESLEASIRESLEESLKKSLEVHFRESLRETGQEPKKEPTDSSLVSTKDQEEQSLIPLYLPGQDLSPEDVESYHDWNEALFLLADELAAVGVDRRMQAGLAAFLFCAWKNNVPLLLAGPNAGEIADAFCAALQGRMADQLLCRGEYKSVPELFTTQGRILSVSNLFTRDWLDHISQILGNHKNYYLFTHPFSEDLSIEPRGLYHYMLPLFTDFFVSYRPDHHPYGGRPSPDCKGFKAGAPSGTVSTRYEKLLFSCQASRLYLSQVQHVLGDLSRIPGYSPDWDYYFALIPYLLATGHKEELLASVLENHKLSKEGKTLIQAYLGEEL